MNIIFMGTPEFALPALEALIASEHNILAAYTQPPRPKGRGQKMQASPVHQLAKKHGIPVYTPTSLKSPEAQAEFAALKPDLAVVVAYGLILPQAILDAPTHGCVNIHPSALPRWRGAAPIQRPIMAGDKTTQICIMKMDAGLDTGDVYLRSDPIEIDEDMNAGQLHNLLAIQSADLLLEAIADIASGAAKVIPQSDDGVTYADKISKEEAHINWSWPAEKIHNHIRGLSPFPGATTLLNGEVLKVYKSIIPPPTGKGICGVTTDNTLTITCGDGAVVQLLEIQKPGKPRMSAEEFLRGHPVAKGTKLG